MSMSPAEEAGVRQQALEEDRSNAYEDSNSQSQAAVPMLQEGGFRLNLDAFEARQQHACSSRTVWIRPAAGFKFTLFTLSWQCWRSS